MAKTPASPTQRLVSKHCAGSQGRIVNPPKTATQKALANTVTPYKVTRGTTGRQMDGGSLIPNGRKPPALDAQARQDIALGRNHARDLSPGKKEGA
jgi:hypothetical protein